MKTLTIILSLLLLCFVALANDVLVSFTPNASDIQQGVVKTYSLYYQPTNAPDKNVWTWVYQIPVSTNTSFLSEATMQFPASTLPTNCLIAIESCGLSACSANSAPYFYDYPALLTNVKPQPVSGLGASLILK